MTKKQKNSSPDQPTLFDFILDITENRHKAPVAGTLDIRTQFKAALANDLKHAHDEQGRELSRAQVAARMSDLLGEEISQTTIDNWTAPSHPHRMPADYLPAWVTATGGKNSAIDIISRHSGLFCLPSTEALRAEIQRFDEQEKHARREKLKRQAWVDHIKDLRS